MQQFSPDSSAASSAISSTPIAASQPRNYVVTDDPVLGTYETFELSNRILVTLIPRTGVPVVTLLAAVQAGAVDEERTLRGSAHFLEHAVFCGSASFPRKGELDAHIRGLYGRLNAATSRADTQFEVQVPRGHLRSGLQTIQQLIFEPLLTEAAVNHERGIILSELAQKHPSSRDGLLNRIFPDHGYDAPILGTKESISTMTPDDLRRFHAQHYQPHKISLYIVGEVDRGVERDLEVLLGGYAARTDESLGNAVKRQAPAATSASFEFWASPNTQIELLYPAVTHNPDEQIAFHLIHELLSSKGSYSVFNKLRSEMGTAYSGFALFSFLRDSYCLTVSTEVPCDKSMATLRALRELSDQFVRATIPEEARHAAIRDAKASLMYGSVHPLNAAERLYSLRRVLPFIRGPKDYMERLASLDLREVAALAEKVLSTKPSLILKGGPDSAGLEKLLSRELNWK